MKTKSSLKTFLAGKNPFSFELSCLKGSKQLGLQGVLENQSDHDGQFNQWIEGFPIPWFCDTLDDGTAITYYPVL